MRKAEAVWQRTAESGDMTLVNRWNSSQRLASQFPSSAACRLCEGWRAACCVHPAKRQGNIDHMFYWTAPAPRRGALSGRRIQRETARERAAAFQARGQWGARHFDKVMFNLPIPRFDAKIKLHRDLAAAAEQAEVIAAAVGCPKASNSSAREGWCAMRSPRRASPRSLMRLSPNCSTGSEREDLQQF